MHTSISASEIYKNKKQPHGGNNVRQPAHQVGYKLTFYYNYLPSIQLQIKLLIPFHTNKKNILKSQIMIIIIVINKYIYIF